MTEVMEESHNKLENACKELQVHFVDNRNILEFNHFKDSLHLSKAGKRLLANNLLSKFNNYLSVMQRSNKFTQRKVYILIMTI